MIKTGKSSVNEIRRFEVEVVLSKHFQLKLEFVYAWEKI